jgi:hypothetical protein
MFACQSSKELERLRLCDYWCSNWTVRNHSWVPISWIRSIRLQFVVPPALVVVVVAESMMIGVRCRHRSAMMKAT